MNPNDTRAPAWRVAHNPRYVPRPYYVEPMNARPRSWDDVIRDGLTCDEALALAQLLNAGERDGS